MILRLNSTWNSSFITEHKMPFMNTSKVAKMVGWPSRERQMYKCHELWESCKLGTVYTDADSFVTASVSMPLHVSFTRRRF